MKPVQKACRSSLASLKNFVFDCDGVIWRGGSAIPGAREAIESLRRMGKGVHFVTNNSTLTRVNYMNKFAQLGIPVASNEVISTSFCTAEFLRSSTRGSGRATAPGPKSKCHQHRTIGTTHRLFDLRPNTEQDHKSSIDTLPVQYDGTL